MQAVNKIGASRLSELQEMKNSLLTCKSLIHDRGEEINNRNIKPVEGIVYSECVEVGKLLQSLRDSLGVRENFKDIRLQLLDLLISIKLNVLLKCSTSTKNEALTELIGGHELVCHENELSEVAATKLGIVQA